MWNVSVSVLLLKSPSTSTSGASNWDLESLCFTVIGFEFESQFVVVVAWLLNVSCWHVFGMVSGR